MTRQAAAESGNFAEGCGPLRGSVVFVVMFTTTRGDHDMQSAAPTYRKGLRAEAKRISSLPTMDAQRVALRGHLSDLTPEQRSTYRARLVAGEANVKDESAVAMMIELLDSFE